MEKKGHWDRVAMLMVRGDGQEGALGQSGNVNGEGHTDWRGGAVEGKGHRKPVAVGKILDGERRWKRRGTGTVWQC